MRRVYYYGERDLEGLRHTAKIVDFGIGLSVMAAFNEMRSAYLYLIERSDIYRQKVKHDVNHAMTLMRRRECVIRSIMKDKSFWDDYSDKVVDAANDDVTLFRITIKSILDKHRYKESNIVSYMETARVLLEMSVQHFEAIMDYSRKTYGRDYTADFSDYYVADVRSAWERVSDMIYKGTPIDLNTTATKAAFDKMAMKFGNGEYIQECLDAATNNNPDFTENDIKIIEEESHGQ